MLTKKKVLICPLNWGLGHATRDVPLIRDQLSKGNEVIIAADGYPLKLLQEEFPQLKTIEYPSYPVKYSKRNTQIFAFMKFIPGVFKRIRQEHSWLKKIIKEEDIDVVISDNRFGLWNKDIHTIYITHQVMIKMPKPIKYLEPLFHALHKFYINKYNECWIPDYEENGGLSGDLSHKYPLPDNAKFVGVLSRFSDYLDIEPITTYENVIILSGVEPQRTIFQKQMLDKYKGRKEKSIIIIGKPKESLQLKKVGNIEILAHVKSEELAALFKGCKKIISRSGYTTIMDLETLHCLNKAQLYPTPGQTEQEYLATYLISKGYTHSVE